MTAEKSNMVFLVVVGTVVVLLGLFYYQGLYVLGLSWIFWGLGYVKQKAYTKHLAVTLLIFGSILASLGWYLMPTGTSYRVPIVTIGIGVFTGGVINLIAHVIQKVKDNK